TSQRPGETDAAAAGWVGQDCQRVESGTVGEEAGGGGVGKGARADRTGRETSHRAAGQGRQNVANGDHGAEADRRSLAEDAVRIGGTEQTARRRTGRSGASAARRGSRAQTRGRSAAPGAT